MHNTTEHLLLFSLSTSWIFKYKALIHKLITFIDEFCEEFPHNLIPTPGYWVECSRQKIALSQRTYWDDSDSDHDDARSSNEGHLNRDCNDLYEDDEDSDHIPRWINVWYYYWKLIWK